jgi:hypothetical protein
LLLNLSTAWLVSQSWRVLLVAGFPKQCSNNALFFLCIQVALMRIFGS